MKYLVLAAVFIGTPIWLLNTFVFPELNQMKTFYSNVDQTAARAAGVQN